MLQVSNKQGCRSRGGGGDWGALAPSVFGRSVNPILTRGADYAHHITTGPSTFLDGAASLIRDKSGEVYELSYFSLGLHWDEIFYKENSYFHVSVLRYIPTYVTFLQRF